MIKNSLQKFIMVFVGLLVVLNPFFTIFGQMPEIKAQSSADSSSSTNADADINDANNDINPITGETLSTPNDDPTNWTGLTGIPSGANTSQAIPAGLQTIEDLISSYLPSDPTDYTSIPLDQKMTGTFDKKLIMNSSDYQAIEALYCLSGSDIMPDFENDFTSLFKQYPNIKSQLSAGEQSISIQSADDLTKLKSNNPTAFDDVIHLAQQSWMTANGGSNNTLLKQDMQTVACVTGTDQDQVENIFNNKSNDANSYNALMQSFDDVASMKIDIRILKTLVYLVTPINQGGAGHYRITVNRILKDYTNQNKMTSHESDTILSQSNATAVSTVTSTTTAADLGMMQSTPSSSSTSNASDSNTVSGTVTDNGGTTYDAYLTNAENSENAGADQANISAHSQGTALDISQVDDIRCTLIKKVRVGSDKTTKALQRPIDLAWQTTQGYADSGGQQEQYNDLSSMMKGMASDDISSLVSQFGGDLSDYSGNLSNASFSDFAMVLGKSLFSQVINSPSANLQGYDVSDTLTQLGEMYMASFLGLPSDFFIGKQFNSFDDLTEGIGEAAIEKRLNMPSGSLEGDTLSAMLENVGQTKLETEMDLKQGSLDGFVNTSGNDRLHLVGEAAIENALNIDQGVFQGANFAELKKNVGQIKGGVLFNDPTYINNSLHLPSGTTESLIKGSLSPNDFVSLVGQIRMTDTTYGLKYFEKNDSSFEMLPGTWDNALQGQLAALQEIGLETVAKVFTTSDTQRTAFRQWVTNSLNSQADPTSCNIQSPIVVNNVAINIYKKDSSGNIVYTTDSNGTEQPVVDSTSYQNITISESKATTVGLGQGDLYRLFGCPRASGTSVFSQVGDKILFYAFANYALNPQQKMTVNLTNTSPTIHSSNPQFQFYIDRIYTIISTAKRIKTNWSDKQTDAAYVQMQSLINSSLDAITTIVNNSMSITSIDSLKTAAGQVSLEADYLQKNVNAMNKLGPQWANKINGTIIDINNLIRAIAEVMQGSSIPSSQTLTLGTIPSNLFSVNNSTVASTSTISKTTIMLLLSGKTTPKDFFLRLGTSQLESTLGLPTNSLLYYVQNYESKGLGSKDALITSIGQATIEDSMGMPAYYFQGPILKNTTDMPNFATDYRALAVWTESDNSNTSTASILSNSQPVALSTSQYFTATQLSTPRMDEYNNFSLTTPLQDAIDKKTFDLIALKGTDPTSFNSLVLQAKNNYMADMQTYINNAGGNQYFEENIKDVVSNISKSKLNMSMRTPENDLLVRMGFPQVDLSALESGNFIAWSAANSRAQTIDQMLGLKPGATRALITGQTVPTGDSDTRLSDDEKTLLSSKMGVSPSALDKFLAVLNKEISPSELQKPDLDVSLVSDSYSNVKPNDTQCQNTFNKVTTGNGTSSMVSAFSTFGQSYLYVDADGTHYFAAQNQAVQYYSQVSDSKQLTYQDEIVKGLNKITGLDSTTLSQDVNYYINQDNADPLFKNLSDAQYATIESTYGISKDLLNKLFNKSIASDANKPLVAYKEAVGTVEIEKIITYKLFGAIGINLSSYHFTPDDFFSILNGDFSPMYKIAGSVIDKQLGLPAGATLALITAPTDALRQCSLDQLGADMIGKALGLNYISLQGNIYDNIGRSKIEQTLGVSRNSFHGNDISELIDNIGPINFAIAFHIPLSTFNQNGHNLSYYTNQIFSSSYASTLNNGTALFKLTAIKNFIGLSGTLPSGQAGIISSLNQDLKLHIISFLNSTNPNWNDDNFVAPSGHDESSAELRNFIAFTSYLDSAFNLSKGTTGDFLAEKSIDDCDVTPNKDAAGNPDPTKTCNNNVAISPDSYVSKVANSAVISMAADKLIDLLGGSSLSDSQKNAIKDIANHFQRLVLSGDEYGNLYADLSRIFPEFNIDVKLGLTPGTTQKILNDPEEAGKILLPQAAAKLDSEFGLTVIGADGKPVEGSFTYMYQTTLRNSQPQTQDIQQPNTSIDQCSQYIPSSTNPSSATAQASDDSKVQLINAKLSADQNQKSSTSFSQIYGGNPLALDNPTLSNKSFYTLPSIAPADQATFASINQQQDTSFNQWNSCEQALGSSNSSYNSSSPSGGLAAMPAGAVITDWTGWQDEFLNAHTAVVVAANHFSRNISTAIANATQGSVVMPAGDVIKLASSGDMRYLEAAGLAYGANMVIDYLNPNNSQKLAPAGLRISYDMVRLMVMGDIDAENFAADAATANILTGDGDKSFDNSYVDYRYDDLCTGNATTDSKITCITQSIFYSNGDISASLTNGNMITGNEQTTSQMYGYNPAADKVDAQAAWTDLQNQKNTCDKELASAGTPDLKLDSGTFDKPEDQIDQTISSTKTVSNCQPIYNQYQSVIAARQNAIEQSDQIFQKDIQYRMLDATFWGHDHNVFPGFSYALTEGDSTAKIDAITQYLKNGLINGQFFGQDIPWLKSIGAANIAGAADVFVFANSLRSCSTDPNCTTTEQPFNLFAKSSGFSWFNNYVSKNSDNWFGFNIPVNMVGGALLAATTGNWGSFANSDASNSYKVSGGPTIPTLGNATFAWGSNKIFTWADKQFGWKPGTALVVYQTTTQVYNAYQTVNQINSLEAANNTLDANIAAGTATAQEKQDFQELWDNSSSNTKNLVTNNKGDYSAASSQAIQAATMIGYQLVMGQIDKMITRTWGNQISGLEQQWNLVPGSLGTLIDAVVSYGIGTALYAVSDLLPAAANPATLIAGLILFIGINLFGVYKVEEKCDADGYYPVIEAPATGIDSSTGLGVWDGANPNTMQQMTIAAAQAKAKQLDQDVMTMHNNPAYTDVVPNQIMTGRQEDVDALTNSVSANICSQASAGLSAISGVCGGNTQIGLWANPQTTAYTHIGF